MSSDDPIDPRDVDPLQRKSTLDTDSQDVTIDGPSPAERLRTAPEDVDREDPEEDAWEGGYSGKAMIGNWIGAGIVSLLVILLMILLV